MTTKCPPPDKNEVAREAIKEKRRKGIPLSSKEKRQAGGFARAAKLSKEKLSSIGKSGAEGLGRKYAERLGMVVGPAGYVGAPCGRLLTPGGYERACYQVLPAEALITSHNPETFRVDPRYPPAVQERDYTGDKNEQAKVLKISAAPDPAVVLANNPTAVDGPPVIAASGIVLGGNGRTMGLKLAYSTGKADAYRAELVKRAPMFGLESKDVESVKDPILVRVVDGLDSASPAKLAAASSRYNEGLTGSLDERAAGVAAARRLSADTLSTLSESIAKHGSLRAAMDADGPAIIARLRKDGLITDQSAASYIDGGDLTEKGKMLVEGAFLGLVAGTPERLSQASAKTLQRVERIAPSLARVRARENGHDAIPAFQRGMDLLHKAKASKMTLAQLAGQGVIGEKPPDAQAIEAAGILDAPINMASDAAKAWAKAADFDPKQATLFGAHPKPAETWETFRNKAGVPAAPVLAQPPEDAAPLAQTPPAVSSQPVAAPTTGVTFAETLAQVLPQVHGEGRFGASKVFASEAFKVWPDKALTLADFKAKLLEAQKAGQISLSKADFVAAMDPALIQASEIKDGDKVFHFINDPGVFTRS